MGGDAVQLGKKGKQWKGTNYGEGRATVLQRGARSEDGGRN